MPVPIRYHFKQRFAVPARQAFQWCTSYDPKDHELMGDKGAERVIIPVAEGTTMLQDTFPSANGKVEKKKLVQLYPDQLTWVSTHLTGPNQYSQFFYRISSESKESSVLEFIGIHMDYQGGTDAEVLAKKLCREDAYAWKLLAKAMEKDLKK